MHIIEPISVTNLTLNDTCLRNSTTVALRCNVQGFPRPTMIQFLLNDTPLAPEVGKYVSEFYDQVRAIFIVYQLLLRIACYGIYRYTQHL